jgi:hypothetical protein
MITHLSVERQSFARLIRYLVSDAFLPVATPFRIGSAGFFFDGLRVKKVEFASAVTTRTFYVNGLDAAGAVVPVPGARGNGYVPIRMRVDFDLGIVFQTEMNQASFGKQNVVTLHIRDAYFLVYIEMDPHNGPVLNVIPDHLPDLPIPQRQKDAIRQALTIRNPLRVESAFGPLRGAESTRILNAGVSFASDKNIVIRLEFASASHVDADPAARLSRWIEFFGGKQPSHLGNHQWAIVLPTDALLSTIQAEAAQNLTNSKDFEFTRSPSVQWLANQPAFRLDTAGSVSNACGGNNIRVDLWTTARMEVPKRNVIRINVSLGYSKDAWDVVKCLGLLTLFWPILGFVTFIDKKAPWWAFSGYFFVLAIPWIIPVLYIFGRATGLEETLLANALKGEINGTLNDGPEIHEVGEFEYYVDIPVPPRDPLLRDWVALDEISATGTSLIVRGALLVPEPVMPRLQGALWRGFRSWELARPCENLRDRSTTAEVDLAVTGDVEPRPNIVLKGTDPPLGGRYWIRYEVVDDRGGVYTGSYTRFDYTNVPGRLKVTVTNPPESFRRRPYPLKLRFLTSGGARIYTIPAPPRWPVTPRDPEERRRQEIAVAAWQVSTCYWKQNILTLVKALQVFWLPRPAEQDAFAQHWLVRIAGLEATDAITAWDGETGRQLARVRSASGEIEVSLVLPPERSTGSLMLTLNDTPFLSADAFAKRVSRITPRESPGQYSVDSRQTPLFPMGTLEFGTEVERLDLLEDRGMLALTAHSLDGVKRFYEWGPNTAPVLRRMEREECAPSRITSRAAGFGQAVGAFDRGGGLFRVWDGTPQRVGAVLGEYSERPWFAGGAIAGSTFVQVNDDLRTATVYRRGDTVEGGIAAPGWEHRGPEDAPLTSSD